jgi:hypothetical protein
MRRFHRLAPPWVALLSLLISVMLALFTPLPAPQFHDEFSYLLAGDTFAHGRLTNRPHPLWESFETFQVIQQPSYMSKYQPGQGLMLALGQVLTGEPIVGVWISTALAGAAVWWALAGIVPRRWATIGALIAATHPLMLKWNWSYWGGAVAVIGAALAVGGLARIRTLRISTGVAIGVGLFILFITRPFEGAVLLILTGLLIRAPSPRSSPGGRGGKTRPLLAMTVMFGVGLAWSGYYNWRVAGSALRLPYVVYESTYAVNPPFLWMRGTHEDRSFRHDAMRRYYLGWELPQYRERRHQPIAKKLWDFAREYFYSVVIVVPVLLALRDPLGRRALVVAVVFTLVTFGNLWFFPHYAAPAVPVYLLIVVLGLRQLRALRGGRWLVRGILALHVVACAVVIVRMDRTRDGWNYRRADFIEQVREQKRKVLVIVRPSPDSYTHNELVYNDADIDASAVVWSRDMGREPNERLIAYFRGREVWLLREGGGMEPYQ